MLKGGLDGPAVGVQGGDRCSRSVLWGEVGEEVELGLTLASRRVQLDRNPADDECSARVRLGQTHSLFIKRLATSVLPDRTALALPLSDHVRPMLANHKKCAPPRHPKQKPQRAKIAISHNTIPCRHHRHHLREQRAFLRVGVFTRNDIGGDSPLRIIEDEGMAGQCSRPIPTECFHPMLRPCQMVPVQDAHAIACSTLTRTRERVRLCCFSRALSSKPRGFFWAGESV